MEYVARTSKIAIRICLRALMQLKTNSPISMNTQSGETMKIKHDIKVKFNKE